MNVIRSMFLCYRPVQGKDFTREHELALPYPGDEDDRSNPLNEAPIMAACRNSNPVWLRELLETDPHQASRPTLSGAEGRMSYPLLIAAGHGFQEGVKLLLGTLATLSGADRSQATVEMINASHKKSGETALIIAAHNGDEEIVRYLTDSLLEAVGAWPEAKRFRVIMAAVNGTGENGATPICMAAQGGHLETVQYLVGVLSGVVATWPQKKNSGRS